MQRVPLIFDIRHFALDDGPGISTTVFLKGCPLSCACCHNPEGINNNQEIVFHSERCIHCGTCQFVCLNQAIDMEKKYRAMTTRCDCCGRCALECPAKAVQIIGEYYSPDELVEFLLSAVLNEVDGDRMKGKLRWTPKFGQVVKSESRS